MTRTDRSHTHSILLPLLLSLGLFTSGCSDSKPEDPKTPPPQAPQAASADLPTKQAFAPKENATQSKPISPSSKQAERSPWSYDATGSPTLTAVSQVAGHYALASSQDNSLEVRDIRQSILLRMGIDEFRSAMPWADLSGENAGPCALSFTPSGRLLFVGVRSQTGDDAILRINMNTKRVDVFHKLKFGTTSGNLGMTHFSGKLYVGTAGKLLRFDATRNTETAEKHEQSVQVPGGATITGLTVDIKDQRLYVATEDKLFRSPIPKLDLGSPIAQLKDNRSISFARTYGGQNQDGLYLLDGKGTLSFVSTKQLRAGSSVSPSKYTQLNGTPTDIAGTACGRILIAAPRPAILSDPSDTRMDFESFIRAQFQGYVDAYKSCLLGYDGKTPEGFPNGTGMEVAGGDPNANIRMGFQGWVMLPILASGILNNDPETEHYIELAAKRIFGFHPDGKGGGMNLDGFYAYTYKGGSGEDQGPANGGLAITHMKFTPALVKTADNYPDNPTLQRYTDYMVDRFQHHSDYVYANKRITKGGGDRGPNRGTHIWGGENFAHAALTAAIDPLAETNFEHYGVERDQYGETEVLKGEPIMGDQPGYIVLSRTVLMGNTTEDPAWRQAGLNYYYTSISVGDDIPSPYATAFSAGHLPTEVGVGWYSATTPGRAKGHGYPIHFPVLLGFGQLDVTSPVVGAYLAYRDGLASPIHTDSRIGTSPEMLFRYVVDHPEFRDPRIGPPDGYFGAMGLANAIQPGILERLRGHWIRPGSPLVSHINGRVQIEFNRLGKRRVFGSDDGTNWIPYGYQRSPYRFARGIEHSHYKVENREGEFLDISNPNFEQGTLAWMPWQQKGSAPYASTTTLEDAIDGRTLQIEANSDAQSSGLTQLLPIGYDLANTRYVLRGVIATEQLPQDASAFLRIRWDDDRNQFNGILSVNTTDALTTANSRREVRGVVVKPKNANFAHIDLVLNRAAASGAIAQFDSISLERLGSDVTGPNGDFERGFENWLTYMADLNPDSPDYGKPSPSIRVIPDPQQSGNYVCEFSIHPEDTRKHLLRRVIKVDKDLEGTRFIYRLDVDEVDLQNADFRIDLERYDEAIEHKDTKDWISSILPQHAHSELVFTNRVFKSNEGWKTRGKAQKRVKRSFEIIPDPKGDTYYVLKFTMQRRQPVSANADLENKRARVVIDNFRRDKVTLYEITDKDAPSPNPPNWQVPPTASSYTRAHMVAEPVADASGRVEYKFIETSGNPGGTSSDWQFDTVYIDEALKPGMNYSYQLLTREMRYKVESKPSTPTPLQMPLSEDCSPPASPTWTEPPAAASDSSIRMQAAPIQDSSAPVHYRFAETSGAPGGSESGWQASPIFIDEDLRPGTTYHYTVQARDAAGNVGQESAPIEVTTSNKEPPTPNQSTFALAPRPVNDSKVHMVATVAHDANCPVEYYFEETTGNPGATDSGWQILAEYTDFGLRKDTEYRYRVRTRDAAGNTGQFSVEHPVKTFAFFDETPPEPNRPTWKVEPAGLTETSIAMTATAGTDLSPPVEYYFEEMTGEVGADSSTWQRSPTYRDNDLRRGAFYRYRVKMRDARGNQTAFSEPVKAQPKPSRVMVVRFERDKVDVNYFGEDVSDRTSLAGTAEQRLLTITGVDVDGRGGKDDTIRIAIPVTGNAVQLERNGYVFNTDDWYTFQSPYVEVLAAGSHRSTNYVKSKKYRSVFVQRADPYDIISGDHSFSVQGAKKDTDLPDLDSFSIRNTTKNSQNRIRSFRLEIRFGEQFR
jgi:chitodextrinase